MSFAQIGSDIDGEARGDSSGNAVSLSSDGSSAAVDHLPHLNVAEVLMRTKIMFWTWTKEADIG